ncbi:MAG TPA: XrtA/PEP-CTERM system TPR-repeat protein PrsT, partial [Lamprocystis sp. (in: g-proteobacteria)]|nr:XrtA/PEP-CTERM system TPR-repeat protein PrsT [Lamprocystis sp. (in: g-proteobacteria)]
MNTIRLHCYLARFVFTLVCSGLAWSAAAKVPLDQARTDWESGKTRAAVVALKGILQQDPQDAAARDLLVRVYLEAGQAPAAVEVIDQARALGAPRHTWIVELAEAELLRGRLTEVLAIDATAADTPRRRADLLALQGEALLRLERTDEAGQRLAQGQATDPDSSRVRLAQALLARQQKDPARARELITATLEREPTSSTAWSLLGELELLEGQAAAARDAFGRALEHARIKGMPHYQRALALIDLNELSAARADLEAAGPDLGGFPGLDLAWGRLLLQQGQPEAALARLETLLKVMPGHPGGLLLAGAAQVALHQPQQAEERLTNVLKAAPGDWRATALLAEARLQRGDAQGAESVLAPLAAGANPPPAVLKTLTQALTALGRQEDARQVLAKLVQAEPGAAAPRLALARSQLGSGEADEAIAGLQELLDRDPDNLTARGLLAFGFLRGGDPAAALSAAEALWDRAPDDPKSLELLGLALLGRDDEAGARLVLNQALTLKPGLPVAALGLAALEQRANRGQAARDLLERTLACAPGESRLILALAGLDLSEDRRPAALQRLTQAVTQRPDNRALRNALARLQLAGNNPAQALQTLGPLPPNQVPAPAELLLRAEAQVAARQPAAAIATLEALVKEDPGTAVAHYQLALLYADQRQTGPMTDHLTQGVRLDGKTPAAGPVIGAVLAAIPAPADRRRLLETLLASAAEQPRVLAELGQLSLADRQTARALSLFDTLQRVAPQEPVGALGRMNALAQAERFA